MRDYRNDPNYWIQFDMDIKDLPVDNILLDNEEDTIRIRELFWNALDIERKLSAMPLDWYEANQFLENGTRLSLKTLDTDKLEELRTIIHDSDGIDNLCIIECRDYFLPPDEEFENVGNPCQEYGTYCATVTNNNIQKKYRINFLYKD